MDFILISSIVNEDYKQPDNTQGGHLAVYLDFRPMDCDNPQ